MTEAEFNSQIWQAGDTVVTRYGGKEVRMKVRRIHFDETLLLAESDTGDQKWCRPNDIKSHIKESLMNRKIYIENPADQTLVAVDDWKKVENPQSAQFVIIMTSETTGIRIHKNQLAGRFNFNEAQEAAVGLKDSDGQGFRCPTRRECLDIYDARFQGLDEALELIGGDRLDNNCIWTCEEDPEPEYSSNNAFFFDGNNGELYCYNKCISLSVRLVTALQFVK